MTKIRAMREADLPLGIKLCRQAGWNQNQADWQRFLAMAPKGCFVAEVDGQPVGTVAAFTFGRIAWIAMVLVDPAARGKGVGTALMNGAIEYLDTIGIESIRLDATPMGQPIYEKLGFTVDFGLARYEGVLPAAGPTETSGRKVVEGRTITPAEADELGEVIALDASVTRTDRMAMLEQVWQQDREAFRLVKQGGRLTGYMFTRPGENATQLGPAIAIDSPSGRLLLQSCAERLAGRPVFADVPDDHEEALQIIKGWGLTSQRPFARMTRGRPVHEDVSKLWLSSGPEKG